MPFVPVPRRNPETSLCEVRKSVRDDFSLLRAQPARRRPEQQMSFRVPLLKGVEK